MNNIVLSGRLGREVSVKEVGQTKLGKTVLAVDDGYGDKKQTYWINLELWGKTAETAEKFTEKGSKVLVSGKLIVKSWEDKEGNKRTETAVNVSSLEFLDSKEKNTRPTSKTADLEFDDLPF